MSDFSIPPSQIAELEKAFRHNNWTLDKVKELCEDTTLAQFDRFLVATKIDCDRKPHIPDGWSIVRHLNHESIRWNPDIIRLYVYLKQLASKKKLEGRYVIDHLRELQKKKNCILLNACVLDWLLKNHNHIPEKWKDRRTFTRALFPGTIYRNADGNECVRYLYWGGGKRTLGIGVVGENWNWGFGLLDDDWRGKYPSLVFLFSCMF